ncbi:hypothetical protein T4E_276 [Trichinella pseudospiralis]|uniref:Uncharacterized protein n=1 Tax=Trichinella pseudospiralis TaxID=6337 RepID=A0A0V0XPK1_TRIPS|nr:hypothetical protein T4E_276 [Trichinella pseudospiralis]
MRWKPIGFDQTTITSASIRSFFTGLSCTTPVPSHTSAWPHIVVMQAALYATDVRRTVNSASVNGQGDRRLALMLLPPEPTTLTWPLRQLQVGGFCVPESASCRRTKQSQAIWLSPEHSKHRCPSGAVGHLAPGPRAPIHCIHGSFIGDNSSGAARNLAESEILQSQTCPEQVADVHRRKSDSGNLYARSGSKASTMTQRFTLRTATSFARARSPW